MSDATEQTEIPRFGAPAIATRIFGWSILTVLAAFLINNVLVVWGGFPGVRGIGGETTGGALMQLALYALAIGAAVFFVMRNQTQSLRWDAHLVHSFNIYLIRALFWSVFLVGVVDAWVAFMRAEELAGVWFGDAMGKNFARASWLGTHVHVPLVIAGFVIALFTRTLGFTWLALLIVAAELLIVISRFVFSYEQALMGDLVRYWYAALFLFASAYTLYDEGHVRVDVLYAGLGRTTRGYLNAQGTILFGLSTAWVIMIIAFNGPQSIVNAPIKNFEISQAGPFGMYIKYQMAAFIGVFAITMIVQFVSYFFEAVADKRDEPGHREPAEGSAH
ncbi:TRAP transporter small permease subunit [Actibacterium pelagium]|uniref:TRAP transporter small permease protein n=1 Tax=Actibacterium pelagium TaxID=2029103 RepID=A0A917ELJ1_9RHOB|nr:TRAP transporter small permease subunit [Actibacterium pelagium]GGE52232.1 hypothetical protein GCM10011517_20000 [Actibacterium pelagium]